MADFDNQTVIDVALSKEMKKSYIDYAMSVIVGRALPDVRDGLKPVHRRILYTMHEAGITPDKAYKKCAATVGDVLGKYHPHGDASVYDALARLAQDFSMRYMLVDGQGNFGSVDGDPPAAYRYTEARMSKIALEMLADIDKDTVDFMPNYDDSRQEPKVLPSKYPNLLVNGCNGIAVAMATNIPPHNLGEVIDGVIAVIDDPNITIDELMNFIKGPDFPTGALVMGKSGIREMYQTGRGRMVIRARAEIEENAHGQQSIIVTEIPYMVNKAQLVEKIGQLTSGKDAKIPGVGEVRDESDREGMRIVVEIKKDGNANVILNQLYKFTSLQESFCANMIALVNETEPKLLNLREFLDCYIAHQKQVIVRRTTYDLNKALEREHILIGLKTAVDNIDEVVNTIRSSKGGTADAKAALMEKFALTDIQAQAIIDMRLGRLSGLERQKIYEELAQIEEAIKYYREVLSDESLVCGIIKTELTAVKEKFGDDRRTEIAPVADDIDIEDLIEEEDVVITMTHAGYIKRVPVDTYRSQNRGGRGISAQGVREEDFVEKIMTTSTHDLILFFTNKGKMFKLKAYQIPEAGRTAKGSAIVNLLELSGEEKVSATITLREFSDERFLTFITKKGIVKRTRLSEYDTKKVSGFWAIGLDEDDEVVSVNLTDGSSQILIGTKGGNAIRFDESDAREMGRMARGVRAISLSGDDIVVGAVVPDENERLLVCSEFGYGKKTEYDEYKVQNRGGKGIMTYRISEQTGKIAGIVSVSDDDDIMLITDAGVVIRLRTSEISTYSRVTKGVRLMKLDEGVSIVALAKTPHVDEEEEASSDAESEGETETEGEAKAEPESENE